MAQDPFEDNRQTVKRNRGNFALGVGRVVSAPDNAAHQIAIRPVTQTGEGENQTNPEGVTVMVPTKGDIAIPEVGSLVVFGRFQNRRNVVIGTLYSQQSTIREYTSGERYISNGEGTIRIKEDGTVLINGSQPGGTDTRTDVSDSGTTVVTNVEDINFSTDLSVADDGDGSVTVNFNRYTDEEAQDAVGTILGTFFTYDDTNDTITLDEGEISHDAIDQTTVSASDHHAEPSAGTGVTDEGTNQFGLNVIASSQVTLSSGTAVVDTAISATDATFMLSIGVDDPGADTKVSGRLFWDDSAGTYKVEFVEQQTSVGNPTVNYDIVRVR